MYPYNLYSNKPRKINITSTQQTNQNSDRDINKNLDQTQKIINLDQKILEMLLMAMKSELEDKNYYNTLSQKIDDKQDAEIVYQIGLDEKKHCRYLYDIYKKVLSSWGSLDYDTDEESLSASLENDLKVPELSSNILEDFTNSMLEELDTVEFYRRLLFLFLDLQIKDMLYEIITDEQAHATKLSYLFSKYNQT